MCFLEKEIKKLKEKIDIFDNPVHKYNYKKLDEYDKKIYKEDYNKLSENERIHLFYLLNKIINKLMN